MDNGYITRYSDEKVKNKRQVSACRQISSGEGRLRRVGGDVQRPPGGDSAGVSDCALPLSPTTGLERLRARSRRTTRVPQGPVLP